MDTFQIECLKDGTWSNKIPPCKSKKIKLVVYKDNELSGTGEGENLAIHSDRDGGRNSTDT